MTGLSQLEQQLGKLLIIDDDSILADRLGISMTRKGYEVEIANNVNDGIDLACKRRPDFAVVDLRIEDESGLDLVEKIRQHVPHCKMVMMTAYGNFQTAVAAIKAGAVDYIAKPVDADLVHNALQQDHVDMPEPPEDPMSPDRVKWEHIQRIFEQCDRNVTETARRLQMHRRTLQRILRKHAPYDMRDKE